MANKTLAALAGDLASGKTSARALVEQSLAAIADPSGEGARAFISVDADGARATADHIDHLRKRGRAPSRHAGIPFSVKDLFDLAGEVTTAGSKVLRGAAPATADAPAIARLKQQGFIVLGRSNMTEFAYTGVGLNPHYGTPRSAFDRATGRIPGGSSSGAGVSVADGMCALAIGTDTGGSCRIPASYNGVVGYKPSTGRISTAGAFPLSATLDSIGPIANRVACAAAADAIMAGDWDGAIVPREVSSLRLGVLKDFVLDGLDSKVAVDFEAALARLGKAGATLADVRLPELSDLPTINAKGGILASEALQVHRARIAASGPDYDQRVRARIEMATAISAADYIDIVARRRAMGEAFGRAMAGFDAVLLPTTQNTPPAIAELAADKDFWRFNAMSLRNTTVGNFLNGCAISIPMHEAGTAPTGLMLMAPWGMDQRLFQVAAAVEQVAGDA